MNPTQPIESVDRDEDDCPLVIIDGSIDSLVAGLDQPTGANLAGDPSAPPPLPATTVEVIVTAELHDELRGGPVHIGRPGTALCCAIAVALLLLLVIGWPYYTQGTTQRPFHALHAALRPSSFIGLTLAVAGTATIVASLYYLLRRSRQRRATATVQRWMHFHVVTGIVGPALVLFHAGFVPRSAIGGLALLAMLVVVASGVLGRYVISRIPKDLDGEEVSDDEVRRRLDVYRQKLEQLGVSTAALGEVGEDTPDRGRLQWLVGPVRGVLFGDPASRRLWKQLQDSVGGAKELSVPARSMLILARRICHERHWIVRYRHLRSMIGAWRFVHRWLAVTMLAAVAFHIGVAVLYGGLWIFGG